MKSELYLFQLVDSAFPTGAFSHSFGLETSLKENKIGGPYDLYEWTKQFISGSLSPTEGVAVYLIYQAITTKLDNYELPEPIKEDVVRLDRKLTASKIPSESREGGIKIGKRYLKIVNTLFPDSGLEHYGEWINHNLCYGNSAIVHGWISAVLGVQPDVAIFTHLYTSVNNLLQSALRLTAVGQTDVQKILQNLYPLMTAEAEKIIELSPAEDDMYNFAVTQEIEAMRHETLYSRLFMS